MNLQNLSTSRFFAVSVEFLTNGDVPLEKWYVGYFYIYVRFTELSESAKWYKGRGKITCLNGTVASLCIADLYYLAIASSKYPKERC